MANFEMFHWNFSSSTNPEIGRSGMSDSIFQKQQPEKLLHVRDSIIGSTATASVLLLAQKKAAARSASFWLRNNLSKQT